MHLSHNTLNSMKAILQIMKLQSFGIVIHKVYDKIHKTMIVVKQFRFSK
jgi:hypothetical protein